MQSISAMKIWRYLMVAGVVIGCSLSALQVVPTLLWSFYTIHATHQLLKVFPFSAEQILIPVLDNKPELDEALYNLNQARELRPYNPLAYRWLIKMDSAIQDWQSALSIATMTMRSLDLNSKELKEEIALPFLYHIGQQKNCKKSTESDFSTLLSSLAQETDLQTLANGLLYQGQPIAARGAFCLVHQMQGGKNSENETIRDTILSIMAQEPDREERFEAIQTTHPSLIKYVVDENPIRIPGASLFWMTPIPQYNISFGNPLGTGGIDNGFLWWNGQAAAVIKANHPGKFQIDVNLRDSDPPPTQMALGINGQRQYYIQFKSGSNTWQTVTFKAELKQGLNTINVWFLNDNSVDGKNRDGVVRWLQIHLLQ